jgi:hypothetical protein
MNMRTRVGASVALTAATLALAAPAMAATLTVTDPEDISHGVDLREVKVVNGDANLRVTLTHINLRKSFRTGAGGSVYLDTDPADKGPEYVFAGGFFEGTDYLLTRTEGFGPKQWGKAVRCDYSMRLDYAEEKTRMRMAQDCLGDVDQVSIAVKVAGQRTDGTTLVDWLGEPRELTAWVPRG